MSSTSTNPALRTSSLDVSAFRLLYPDEFHSSFFKEGVRSDGRPIGRARATTVGLSAVPTADGSSLVKIGNTTMLAAVKLEVMTPSSEMPKQGVIEVDFSMPRLCAPNIKSEGRLPAGDIVLISEQIKNALVTCGAIDFNDLCILPGKAAWLAHLDVLCLDADGALLDAALLASLAALADVKLPAVDVTERGRVVFTKGDSSKKTEQSMEDSGDKNYSSEEKSLPVHQFPVALTCGIYGEYLLVDPTAEELKLSTSSLSVILDVNHSLVGLYKPGGQQPANIATFHDCIASAQLRVAEMKEILFGVFKDAGIVTDISVAKF